jgi:hypothetical protein
MFLVTLSILADDVSGRFSDSNEDSYSFLKQSLNVRFEVSTAVTMMIIIFWEMTPCGSYKNRL